MVTLKGTISLEEVFFRGTIPPKEVTFVGKLAYLSAKQDRLCICIPLNIRRFVDKDRPMQVTLRPLGSLR